MSFQFFDHLSANLQFLDLIDPSITSFLADSQAIKFSSSIDRENDVVVFGEGDIVLYKNVFLQVQSGYEKWLQKPSRVLSPRINNSSSSRSKSSDKSRVVNVTKTLLGNDNGMILESLPLKSENSIPKCRHLIMVGSINLLSLEEYIIANPDIIALSILEPNPLSLKVSLSLIDFQEVVSLSKKHNIGLELLVDSDLRKLKHRLCLSMANNYTLSYHGLSITFPSIDSEEALDLYNWLIQPSGFSTRIAQMLGSDCDEYAHLYNAYANINNKESINLLAKNIFANNNLPVILTGSGPSLLDHMTVIKEYENKAFVVASGSSIGSLLRNNINVDVLVLLERSNAVYQDLLELVLSGFDLSSIVLIASLSIDSRIADLFGNTIYFLRPLSSATVLVDDYDNSYTLHQAGPQSTNASIEVIGHLGFKNVFCFGCDFGSFSMADDREIDALGFSARTLDLVRNSRNNKPFYTNSGLLSCSEFFFNSIENYNLNIFLTSDGLELQTSSNISIGNFIDDFFDQNKSASFSSESAITCLLNNCASIDLRSRAYGILQKSLLDHRNYMNTLKESWLQNVCNSVASYRLFCTHINPITPLSSDKDVLSRRLNLLSIFYISQIIYDNPVNPEAQQLACECLDYLSTITENFISALMIMSDSSGANGGPSLSFKLGTEAFAAASVLVSKGVSINE